MQALTNTERLITWVAAGMMLIYITMEGVSLHLIQSAHAIPFCSGFLVFNAHVFSTEDADALYCAAPAVPAQLVLANHQKKKKAARLYVLTMSLLKNHPYQMGEKDIKNNFSLASIFCLCLSVKASLFHQEKKRILLHIFYFYWNCWRSFSSRSYRFICCLYKGDL